MANWKHYTAGLHNVGSYQISGKPWISGSTTHAANTEVRYRFPYVARAVTVINFSDNAIRVHFHSSSADLVSGRHYIELDSDEDSFTFNVKCKEIFISTDANAGNRDYRVYAELTHITSSMMYHYTGSGVTSLS
jgi:hypothetical protein